MKPSEELRELRLWHWREANTATRYMRDRRTSRHTQEKWAKAHTFHTRAVQTLNACFPVGDRL